MTCRLRLFAILAALSSLATTSAAAAIAAPPPSPPPPPPPVIVSFATTTSAAAAAIAAPPPSPPPPPVIVSFAAAAAPPPPTSTPPAPPPLQGGRPIAGSVLLLGEYDWAVEPGSDGNPWSPCSDRVRHALAEARSSAVQFVPTHGFLLSPASTIERFCHFQSGVPGEPSPCEPLSTSSSAAAATARIATFKRDMEHCFLVAMRSGARTIAIRPHLDSGKGDGAWRNSLLLEPTVAYGGFSYEEIMLNPLADAISGAQRRWAAEVAAQDLQQPLPRVDLALQGEMSATVVRFPGEWRGLVDKLRARASAPGCPPVRIGLGINFNRLDDLSSVSQTHESSRLSWASWALGTSDVGRASGVPAIDGLALGDLLRSVEFLSVSAYAPVSGPGFKPDELGNSAFMLVDQLEAVGVPGARDSLLQPDGPLELVYGEVGLGGGSGYKGTHRASSPSEVALRPFFGVYGEHDDAHDPWKIASNAAFRREYFAKLESWMAGGAANKRWDVGAAYLWSKASWDVLEIYDTGYHDEDVARGIRSYNCAIGGAGLWDCVDAVGEPGRAAAGEEAGEEESSGGAGAVAVVVTVSSTKGH